MHQNNQYTSNALPKLLTGMAGVYTLQSLIGGLMLSGLSTYLRDQDLRLDLIGLLSLLMLPWAIKFSWSGLVERWRLQKATTTRSSLVILTGQFMMIAVLVVISFIDPVSAFALLLVLLAILSLLTSTIDIFADGFMIERLLPQHRGWGSVTQISGGYTGTVIGGGVFLILVEKLGWTYAINSMALVGCVLVLMFIVSAKLPLPETRLNGPTPSLWAALKRKRCCLV